MSIRYDTQDRVAVITFDRPAKLNALTLSMYRELGEAFQRAADDTDIRAIVLTGAGNRSFCVGADLTESIPALARNEIDISCWDPAHLKHVNVDKPIIAAVNGLCMGGGFEIMLATDLRIASDAAVFSLPEVSLGIVPAGGTLARLTRQISRAHAMELLLTAGRFSAADMLRMGVVNRVTRAKDCLDQAVELAVSTTRLSPGALQVTKRAVRELADLPLEQAFVREAELGQLAFTSDDAQRGLQAFSRGDRVTY